VLFQKLYNWIKYKTLPPSVLFKNRLFVERDSKNRRIFSNFGLTFRNSKWSSYSNANVSTFFKNSYFNFFFFLTFFFFFIKFFSFSLVLNQLFFIFWFAFDCLDYYLSFSVWALSSIYLTATSSILSFFLEKPITSLKKNHFDFRTKNVKRADINFSQDDLNWFLYSWLTTSKQLDSEAFLNESFEDFFEDSTNSSFWKTNFSFFINLYKSVFFLKLNDEGKNFYQIKYFFNSINSMFSYRPFLTLNLNNFNNNNFFLFFLDYKILNNPKPLVTDLFKNSKYSNRFNWSLSYLENQDLNENSIFKASAFSFNNFNTELLNLFNEKNSITNVFKNNFNAYGKITKWDRWLYKYSIIHRKSFKFFNKLSNIKKSLNFSIFDNLSFSKNIWTPIFFKQNLNLMLLFNNTTSDKEFFLKHHFFLNQSLRKTNSLTSFSFYDESYAWFLKRFYFLNSISTNDYRNKFQFFFENNDRSLSDNFLLKKNNFDYCYYFFLKNSSNYLLDLNYSHDSLYLKKHIRFLKHNAVNDIYLYNEESDFFSKDFLQNLIYLTYNTDFIFSNTQRPHLVSKKKKKVPLTWVIPHLCKNYTEITINLLNDY